jgi:hypothetical protein
MSFKVDFSKMKKVHSDEHHTIMEHPDGHQVRIAHSALSRPLKSQLDKLPMASGGEVPDVNPKEAKKFEEGAKASGWQPKKWAENLKKGLTPVKKAEGGMVKKKDKKPKIQLPPSKDFPAVGVRGRMEDQDRQMYAKGTPDEPIEYEQIGPEEPLDYEAVEPLDYEPAEAPAPEQPLDYEPVPDEAPAAAQAPSMPDLGGMPAGVTPENALEYSKQQLESMQPKPEAPQDPMQMGLDSISQQANIEAGMASERAKALAGEQAAMNTLQTHFQDKAKEIQSELEHFVSDIKDTHINPDRYMGSMQTGQRIATALALALGGFGAGMTGGPNEVLNFINKQIDNDIEAQKQDLGKKETLFSANLKRFNNLQEATDMTRLMIQAKGVADMNRIAAKAAGPMAQAKAQQLQAAMIQQALPTIQQMALRQATQTLEQGAAKDPGVYPELIKAYENIDPKKAQDLRQRYVPGVGMAFTPKDASDIKDMSSTIQGAQAGIKDLLQIAGTPGKSLSLTERARAQEIRQSLIGALRLPITGPGAMNEGERRLLESMIPDPAAIFSLDINNKTRLEELSNQLDSKLERLISARGLGKATAQTEAKQEIKTMNGIRYKKVPGGWQKAE